MKWDDEVDVLIFGAGAAGMTAALVARCEGLDARVFEKTSLVGGTTATSGGTAWVPGNSLSMTTSHPDNLESARTYMTAEIGLDASGLREAFLTTGAEAVDYLARHTEVKFKANDPYPDYHAEQPGGAQGGRGLSPLPFDGALLGADFAKLRAPIPEFMVFGGMMVSRDEIKHLIRPWRSFHALKLATTRLLQYVGQRLRHHRGTRLVLGNALAGRLFYSCRQKGVPIELDTRLVELVMRDGRVDGAIVQTGDIRRTIRARLAVVLSTGGCAGSREWRDELAGRAIPHTNAFDCASGDGLSAGLAAGATLGKAPGSAFWWAPSSQVRWPNGRVTTFPHIRDRAKPGLIAVNGLGLRFVNEANSYHDFVSAMLASNPDDKAVPAWLVCDRSFVRDYGLGAIHPVWQRVGFFERIGYVLSAPTIEGLAAKMGVDAAALAASVMQHNLAAITGVDDAFGKGSKALNRLNGDADHAGPNKCLRPIEKAPFYAVPVYPAPLGASTGLRTNSDGQVLNADTSPIPGLYACGNDMSSVMQGNYPGPGSTLGPAIVFAYRVAMHASRSQGARAVELAHAAEMAH
jgi:3-oxosteroid 1-dehydrogenase